MPLKYDLSSTETKVKETFCKRFKELYDSSSLHTLYEQKKEKGETFRQFVAAELGVSESTVQNWLDGSRIPDATKLARISEYFRVSCDWLVNETVEPRTPKTDLRAICDYTGLTDNSVECLHFLNSGLDGDDTMWVNNYSPAQVNHSSIDYLNYELEKTYARIKQNKLPDLPVSSIFSVLWEYIFAFQIKDSKKAVPIEGLVETLYSQAELIRATAKDRIDNYLAYAAEEAKNGNNKRESE